MVGLIFTLWAISFGICLKHLFLHNKINNSLAIFITILPISIIYAGFIIYKYRESILKQIINNLKELL